MLLIVFLLKLSSDFVCMAETSSSLLQALFPFKDWWVVPAKVAFDQTLWAALWNSIYYVVLGFLRRESPANIYTELKSIFWPMLTVRNFSYTHLASF